MEWIDKKIESKVLTHYSGSFRPNLSHNPLPWTYQIPEDETLTYMQRKGVCERKRERGHVIAGDRVKVSERENYHTSFCRLMLSPV